MRDILRNYATHASVQMLFLAAAICLYAVPTKRFGAIGLGRFW